MSTGDDRTILGNISRRGNRYLRTLFVQAAWVVLVKVGPKQWERYGLKSWIEAAKKRLHHNVLEIALANKLVRIAWAVLHKGRAFEDVKTNATASRSVDRRAVLRAVKAWPGKAQVARPSRRPALTVLARGAPAHPQAGTKERPPGTNKGTA
jgi:hypothetical protein